MSRRWAGRVLQGKVTDEGTLGQDLVVVQPLGLVQHRRDVQLLEVENRQHVVEDLVVISDSAGLIGCLGLLAGLHPLEEPVGVDARLLVPFRERRQTLEANCSGLDSVPVHGASTLHLRRSVA